jgi:uncharacterized protein YkwD
MRKKHVASLCLLLAVSFAAVPADALDLNGLRAASRRPPLRLDGALAAMAASHAADLARRDRLDHAGFKTERGPGGARAENVAYGCPDQACTIRQWSRSARHRANMLRADVHGYGIASAVSSSGRRYWVLVVGR